MLKGQKKKKQESEFGEPGGPGAPLGPGAVGLWVCTWFPRLVWFGLIEFGLVWSGYAWFGLVKFGLVWSIHIQTNKLNNCIILINLICEFVCWQEKERKKERKKKKQTDRYIKLLRN